jgi:2-polyprenyl-3-methyl-5-hydroxy-6-metoxy-1,4-benzoquinol methylase
MIDREAVRTNAKYLRNVRPIDPDEIYEYIEDQPHPAVVRETLREEAFELGLRERADGTFVPASTDPIPDPMWQPDMLPRRYDDVIADHLVERFGPEWYHGDSGAMLRSTIRRLKRDYYQQNPVEYDQTVALGYAIYHFADYYAAIGYVLDDLLEQGCLSETLRILDVGAGVGGPAVGIHDYLPESSLVEYHAVEPSAGVNILTDILAETRRNFRTTIHHESAESFDPTRIGSADNERPFDLVLCANVLSELNDPSVVAKQYLSAVATDGSFIGLAPADKHTSIRLRAIERMLTGDVSTEPPFGHEDQQIPSDIVSDLSTVETPDERIDATVYAPTLRLWSEKTPADRGWSFDRRPMITAPPTQQRLDDAPREAGESEMATSEQTHNNSEAAGDGTFRNETVQFSYTIIRRDGTTRAPVSANPRRHAAMEAMETHVTNRIDLLGVKLSHDLTTSPTQKLTQHRRGQGYSNAQPSHNNDNPVFKIGDGSQTTDNYAVVTVEDTLTESLLTAEYGAVLAFENVLCLWNDDEDAYNLVVDDESVVDVIA